MQKWIEIQKQLVPDLMKTLKKRYTILHHVMLSGVIGRRNLAALLDMTERTLRSEIDILKEQGLLETESIGMKLSENGKRLLDDFQPYIKELFGLSELEKQICDKFGLKQVVIVPGDSDGSELVKKELGRAGASVFRKLAAANDIIAVAGGSTMAEVANGLNVSSQWKGNVFVPARGGLGERVELQANTIASIMATKTGCSYRLLHVPDHLGEEAYHTLMQDPNIQEIIDVIRRARIVLHGIGDAMTMAKRRKTEASGLELLKKDGALAEAFGYYFDEQGRVVHNIPTVGLRIEDIMRTEVVIGIAGGKSKGKAIAAVLRFGHEDVLVTDQAAAEIIVES
ncbi:sugar-binding transcriptional regulator [Marinicrinis lubricantis]|uniref:Sugar-binding transcriptional regulator n=1 Tax=Marinicrinis lubricantis TaxID=2086470 RepID=A0ABW1IPM8_9BACL